MSSARAIAVAACLGALLAGCDDHSPALRSPTAAEPPRPALLPAPGSLTLAYLCGNAFSVRSANDSAVVASYAVAGTTEAGTLTLPPRAAGAAESETFLTTNAAGALRLSVDGTLVAEAANAGASCPARASLGEWSAQQPWPVIAIHATLLPDGRVLAWGGDPFVVVDTTGEEHGSQIGVLWDPQTHTFTDASSRATDLFCSGHALLGDGRLLVTGGHVAPNQGLRDANLFDYRTGSWTRVPFMQRGRWYPTNTTLANGEMLTVSGNDGGGWRTVQPEVWTAAGTWRVLTSAARNMPYYPWMFLAPNGRVFDAGPSQGTRSLNTAGTGKWGALGTHVRGARDKGSAVMYEPGRVIVMGGQSPPTSSAEVIDLTATAPAWRLTAPMAHPRRLLNATLIADGRVLVTGGTRAPGVNDPDAVLPAEVWSPATQQWTTLASMSVPRLYHSSALLLPDGRVLSAGGGRCGDDIYQCIDHPDAEIFSPPYLFRPDGAPAARPTIGAAPASTGYGRVFEVASPEAASIRSVLWIRLSSVTHGFNSNQRLNRLSFTLAAGKLSVTAPADPRLAPPGHYLLFLIDHNGVPSAGQVVQLR